MSGVGEKTASLPVWRVVLSMVAFRPWLWLVDLLSVIVFRAAWQLAPALIIQAFFNLLTGEAPLRFGVWTVAAFLVSAWLGRVLGGYGFYRADVPIFADMPTLLRKNLLCHILRRPGASPLPDSAGEAVSRFRGDVMEIPMFVLWLNDLLTGLGVIAVSIVLMARTDARITALALAPLLAVGLIANLASGRIESCRRSSRKAAGAVTGFLGEFFGAVQAVKVATAEKDVIGRFRELNDSRRSLTLREVLFNGILESVYGNMSAIGTGVILFLVGGAMREGSFTIGDFSMFVYLLGSLGDLAAFGGMLVARYRQLSVSVQRMVRLMEGAPVEALVEAGPVDLAGPLPEVRAPVRTAADRLERLEAAGLSYLHPGTKSGVEGVDLRLERGTLTVVTGRVGSGKTTLLRVLLGLLPRQGGEVFWNGRPVEDPAAFFVPPRAAYTAQVPRLFSDTLRGNILLGLQGTDGEILEAVRLAVMEGDLEELETGLDTLIGARGVKLSGGQAQRAAAARMFIRRPELLVFDDLSSALDVETEKRLWERLFSRGGATCLAVSHRRPVLRRADNIIVLQGGRPAAQGKLEDLLRTCGEMRRLWRREADGRDDGG